MTETKSIEERLAEMMAQNAGLDAAHARATKTALLEHARMRMLRNGRTRASGAIVDANSAYFRGKNYNSTQVAKGVLGQIPLIYCVQPGDRVDSRLRDPGVFQEEATCTRRTSP